MYNQGYAYVLILKAFFYHGMRLGHECILIPGMANEGLGNFDTALGTYLQASDYIYASKPSAIHFSVQKWIGKILYRVCMLSLRLRDPIEAIDHFRRYKNNFRTNFSIHERLIVYYWYWRTLADMVQKRIQQKPTISDEPSVNGDAPR